MDPIYTKCDKSCGHTFYVKHFKKDKLHKGIEKTYFNCPNCKHEYVCFYTDAAVRKMQSKMRELHRKLKWLNDDDLERFKQKETTLRGVIKQRMDIIRQQVKQHEQQTT